MITCPVFVPNLMHLANLEDTQRTQDLIRSKRVNLRRTSPTIIKSYSTKPIAPPSKKTKKTLLVIRAVSGIALSYPVKLIAETITPHPGKIAQENITALEPKQQKSDPIGYEQYRLFESIKHAFIKITG